MPISYHELAPAKLKDRRRLSGFLKEKIQELKPEIKRSDISFVFCDDAYLIEINRQFLDHDTYTDIITFDLSEDPQFLQSEIYISVERVAENAAQFSKEYNQELHRVIFHGVLHLCGLKDKTVKEQKAMRSAEDSWLNTYFATA